MSLEILEYGVAAIKEHCLDQDTMSDMTLERWSTLLSQLEDLDFLDAGAVNAEEIASWLNSFASIFSHE